MTTEKTILLVLFGIRRITKKEFGFYTARQIKKAFSAGNYANGMDDLSGSNFFKISLRKYLSPLPLANKKYGRIETTLESELEKLAENGIGLGVLSYQTDTVLFWHHTEDKYVLFTIVR